MSNLSVSNTFVTTEIVDASLFNTNYSDIVAYINNRNSGSATWDMVSVSHATNVPITANNSTGTQDIANFTDNGVLVGEIFNGGIISWPYQDFAQQYTGLVNSNGQIANGAGGETSGGGGRDGTLKSQTHSSLDVVTGKFTAQKSGKYLVVARTICTSLFSMTGGTVTLSIYKNGVQYAKAQTVTFLFLAHFCVSDIISAVAGDYFEIYITNNTGTSIGQSGPVSGVTDDITYFLLA